MPIEFIGMIEARVTPRHPLDNPGIRAVSKGGDGRRTAGHPQVVVRPVFVPVSRLTRMSPTRQAQKRRSPPCRLDA